MGSVAVVTIGVLRRAHNQGPLTLRSDTACCDEVIATEVVRITTQQWMLSENCSVQGLFRTCHHTRCYSDT